MPVPPIRLKKITPASRPVLKECRHPPRRTSVIFFSMEELGGRRCRRTVADLVSEGKRGCLIVCQKVQLRGSGGKARLSDCVSEGSVVGLRGKARLHGVWSVCGMLARFPARRPGRESVVVAF